jgi:mitogen-activated protein kinase kinase kinase 17/18
MTDNNSKPTTSSFVVARKGETDAATVMERRWTRVRTLGRGASGAEVFLAAEEATGRLLAVKSVPARGAAALVREQGVMAGLRPSPHVVPCFGGRACRDGSYQLFLEYAPGGSLADAAARGGGRLGERDARRAAADVARGLAHVHGAGVVHGDVKPRNVVLGADGRAKLADFGCAGSRPVGGTPAYMAPEVARGEAQGPAADVWALGCTVLEMATGRAPWSSSRVDHALATLRLVGYTDAAPEVPEWLPADARDFLRRCLARRASDRPAAAELLDHPFIASASASSSKMGGWVSPKSTLDAAFWESDDDTDEDEVARCVAGAAARIKGLACSVSTLPDWDSDGEGWIHVTSTPNDSAPAYGKAAVDDVGVSGEVELRDVEPLLDIDADSGDSDQNVGATDERVGDSPSCECDGGVLPCKSQCNTNGVVGFVLAQINAAMLTPVGTFREKNLLFKALLCFVHRIFSDEQPRRRVAT